MSGVGVVFVDSEVDVTIAYLSNAGEGWQYMLNLTRWRLCKKTSLVRVLTLKCTYLLSDVTTTG